MPLFDPLRDFFQRRHAAGLDALASRVQLLNRRSESPRGNFVFPGIDYLDDIEVGGHRVGQVDYGINPLQDRVYINMIEIVPALQGLGIGLGVLWHLWLTHRVPIVPLYQYTIIRWLLVPGAPAFCSGRRRDRGRAARRRGVGAGTRALAAPSAGSRRQPPDP